jgi:hypothetical protein
VSRPCPKCAADDFRFVPSATGREGGVRCNKCGTFWWQPKPENEKTKRPARHVALAKKYGQGFCEMCLRQESELPATQDLDGHHVLEYADGGTDDRANVWVVCTSCHRLIHHQRTYLGHYHSRSDEDAA